MNSNNKIPAFFTVILVCLWSSVSGGNIIYPWNATSAIVKAGESFSILFDAGSGESADSVVLRGPYNSVSIPAVTSETGSFKYDNLTGGACNTRVSVPVPAAAPEDLYDLILYSSAGENISLSAVKVVRKYKTNYTIILISDPHISRHYKDGYAKELEWFTNLVDISNIIGPDLVVITGDCIHESTKDGDFTVQEKWDNYYKGHGDLQGVFGFRAPSFSMPGNHDYFQTDDGAAQWNEYNGLRVYNFTYGESRFMVLDNFQGDDYSDQLSVHQAWLDEVGPGNFRALAQHNDRAIPTSFCDQNQVQLALVDHAHPNASQSGTGSVDSTPTVFSIPGSASNITTATGLDNVGWFRVVKVNGHEVDILPKLQYADNVEAPPSDHNILLRLEYSNPNDGSATTNSITVTNDYDVTFPGFARFVMAKGNYEIPYGGTIEQVIENDTATILDVRFEIGANTTTQVETKLDNDETENTRLASHVSTSRSSKTCTCRRSRS